MAQHYNKHHAVHILAVGDTASGGILRGDRAKAGKIIAKPQSERHKLLTQYGVWCMYLLTLTKQRQLWVF